jgi:hypothetical protein
MKLVVLAPQGAGKTKHAEAIRAASSVFLK